MGNNLEKDLEKVGKDINGNRDGGYTISGHRDFRSTTNFLARFVHSYI